MLWRLSQCKITLAYEEPRLSGNPKVIQTHLAISTILIAFRKAILISYTFFFDNCFDIEERTRNKRTYNSRKPEHSVLNRG